MDILFCCGLDIQLTSFQKCLCLQFKYIGKKKKRKIIRKECFNSTTEECKRITTQFDYFCLPGHSLCFYNSFVFMFSHDTITLLCYTYGNGCLLTSYSRNIIQLLSCTADHLNQLGNENIFTKRYLAEVPVFLCRNRLKPLVIKPQYLGSSYICLSSPTADQLCCPVEQAGILGTVTYTHTHAQASLF